MFVNTKTQAHVYHHTVDGDWLDERVVEDARRYGGMEGLPWCRFWDHGDAGWQVACLPDTFARFCELPAGPIESGE